MTVAAMAVAIAATAAVVTAAKARRDPSAAALLRRWRCWRALAAAALVTAAVGTASLAAAAFVTAEAPLEPPSQGVGGPRPGDAKRLLGSSQDEHAAAVHCYGTHSGSVASPRMRRAPPLRFAVEVGIQAVLPTRCDAASSTCWCCWCWVSRLAPTTKFRKAKTGQDSRAVQKGGGDSGK